MRIPLILFFSIISTLSIAQFTGTNLSEYQYGRIPGGDDESFHSLYNKLMLNYQYQGLKLTGGVQIYQTPYSDRNYVDLSWISLNYRKKGWEVKVGNFNETLARGILLRSYEIPAAILEDKGFRSKQYFYRDLLGASIGYKSKRFSLKGVWGYALNNVYPPTQPWGNRRFDQIGAFNGDYSLKKQTLGLSILNVKNKQEDSYYGLGSLSGQILPSLSYYGAYALLLKDKNVSWDADTHAIYASITWSIGQFGLSFEVKDYNNFIIGTGINEPPALVREHSYRVLNRSTHVLQPENETGFQLEAFYQPSLYTNITLNYTSASNDFGKHFNYNEWFAELSTVFGEKTDFKGFIDYADDPFKGESNRISSGIIIDQSLKKDFGIKLELEFQTFDRNSESTQNYVTALTVRYKSKWFVNVLGELSNDLFVTDNYKSWLGSNIRYKLNSRNSFQFFAGERRGGPACSAGICYEVLDFKGVELRWMARF